MNTSAATYFILATALVSGVRTAAHRSRCSYASQGIHADAILVELAIVCDKEFGDMFQQDRQKMKDFWAAQLWDLNMRFKSLRKMDLSFKVNQFIPSEGTSDQDFVEEARTSNGTLDLVAALEKFSKWTTRHIFTGAFDIAIFATGSEKLETNSTCFTLEGKSACKHEKNTLLIHFESPYGVKCASLADTLAQVMGAPKNSELEASSGCKDMGYIGDSVCGRNQFFFSKCSDLAISNYIRSKAGLCLRDVSVPSLDVIKYSTNATYPPSLEEQCYSLTGNRNAVVAKEESRCVMAKCMVARNGSSTFLRSFYPLNNSPCDDDKYCFRGRCIPRGFRLYNVGSGKCIHAGDRFQSNDYPIMVDCNCSSTTPLDHIMILEGNPDGIFLATPYSSPNASENDDKCLSTDAKGENLRYTKCSTEDKKWLAWNFMKLNETDATFLVRHSFANTCAGVDAKGDVNANKTCDHGNSMQSWRVFETCQEPSSWFKIKEGQRTEISTTSGGDRNGYSDHLLITVGALCSVIMIVGILVGMILLYVILRFRERFGGTQNRNAISVLYTK